MFVAIQCTRQNEVRGCKQICPAQTCESINKLYFCIVQPQTCIPECVCKPGFFRNKINECISREDCRKYHLHYDLKVVIIINVIIK